MGNEALRGAGQGRVSATIFGFGRGSRGKPGEKPNVLRAAFRSHCCPPAPALPSLAHSLVHLLQSEVTKASCAHSTHHLTLADLGPCRCFPPISVYSPPASTVPLTAGSPCQCSALGPLSLKFYPSGNTFTYLLHSVNKCCHVSGGPAASSDFPDLMHPIHVFIKHLLWARH